MLLGLDLEGGSNAFKGSDLPRNRSLRVTVIVEAVSPTLQLLLVVKRVVVVFDSPFEGNFAGSNDWTLAFPTVYQVPVRIVSDDFPSVGVRDLSFNSSIGLLQSEVVARVGADESSVDGVARTEGLSHLRTLENIAELLANWGVVMDHTANEAEGLFGVDWWVWAWVRVIIGACRKEWEVGKGEVDMSSKCIRAMECRAAFITLDAILFFSCDVVGISV